ncbi:MAG: PTS sugar transporter subunit IIA [Spirochaetia bacterium]|nr:PTS sugar transporter subunit IIA [Spirochaetia bacterium]
MNNNSDILTLNEVAEYLKIAPKTVSRMIQKNEIPCMKIGGQWRFRKSSIDEWLHTKMVQTSEQNIIGMMETDADSVPLSRLLNPDFIRLDIQAGSKTSILRQLLEPLEEHGLLSNSSSLLQKLEAREQMVSTAIGKRTAFPHIRNVRDNDSKLPPIAVGVCPEGTDYESLDGTATYLFFLLLVPKETVHLRIMARLNQLIRSEQFVNGLLTAENPQEFISYCMEADYGPTQGHEHIKHNH